MKFLFDLLPVILFFMAYQWGGAQPEVALDALQWLPVAGAGINLSQAPILFATVVVMLATTVQIAWVHYRHGKVDKMLWASLVLVLLFGGMTLVFHDEAFIKWKPTVLYWLFAGSLFAGLLFKKNPLGAVLGEQLKLPSEIWRRLNLAWVGFFLFMGALNLYVAYSFSTNVWVNYKLFGGIGLMFLFVVAQGAYLMRHVEDQP